MIPAWIRQLFGKTPNQPVHKPARRRVKVKPAVFALEDRGVPALYTVTSASDTAAAHLTLNKVTLDGGKPVNTGGAIFMSAGTLTLNAGTKLQNNTSRGVGDGGAVFMSGGTLNATSTSFTGNQAQNGGALAIT